uniref:Uncharacterized protein n=1 Tax=Panagrolaimus sp. JU765 TaxID=591449 RepID=A0AC34RAJ9_9BILA
MFYLFLWIFLYIGFLIYVIVAVIVAVNVKTDPVTEQLIIFEEWTYLFMALFVSIDLLSYLFTLYSLYVEFKYLQGRIKYGLT